MTNSITPQDFFAMVRYLGIAFLAAAVLMAWTRSKV
jgi:hypothetical protein